MPATAKRLVYGANMAETITIWIRTTILTLCEKFYFTRGRLQRHPIAKSLATDFEIFDAKPRPWLKPGSPHNKVLRCGGALASSMYGEKWHLMQIRQGFSIRMPNKTT
jgi:hypothetical protein